MKQAERDELWARIDERTRNSFKILEDFRKETIEHLTKLNNSVVENSISCAENKTSNKNLWRVMYFMIILVAAALGLGIAF